MSIEEMSRWMTHFAFEGQGEEACDTSSCNEYGSSVGSATRDGWTFSLTLNTTKELTETDTGTDTDTDTDMDISTEWNGAS